MDVRKALMKIQRTNLTSLEPRQEQVLRIANYPNPVFNEMWFLTIDPFVGIPVFIAKLSKRQYCWRVIENFHSQEYIQFFDIHNCLFMRLHFSIGGYDYRRTTRFPQSIHFSITQVLDVLPLGLLPLGLRVLDDFRSLCCMKEFGDGLSWRKLQLSPFTHCPLVSHCQQSPRILCTRCFVP